MQLSNDQGRNMVCLPEKFIYGWIFSIKSESKSLYDYKRRCYEILYDYFHGTITKRQVILKEKTQTQFEIEKLEAELREIPKYKKLVELKAKKMRTGKSLKALDKEFVSGQMELWEQDFSN